MHGGYFRSSGDEFDRWVIRTVERTTGRRDHLARG